MFSLKAGFRSGSGRPVAIPASTQPTRALFLTSISRELGALSGFVLGCRSLTVASTGFLPSRNIHPTNAIRRREPLENTFTAPNSPFGWNRTSCRASFPETSRPGTPPSACQPGLDCARRSQTSYYNQTQNTSGKVLYVMRFRFEILFQEFPPGREDARPPGAESAYIARPDQDYGSLQSR
jgi:hypothetical protein